MPSRTLPSKGCPVCTVPDSVSKSSTIYEIAPVWRAFTLSNSSMSEKQVEALVHEQGSLQDSSLPRSMRAPIVAEAILVFPSGTEVRARTTDLSIAGCYVTTNIQLQRGTAVRVQLMYRRKTFSTMGQVVRSSRNRGIGIQFRTVEPAQLMVLREWLFAQGRAD
jgi:PilZ domain